MAATESAPSDWPTDPAVYRLLGKIGQGAFASVWKATTDTHKDCAVKILNLDHVDTHLAEIRREVQAMRLSSHPNVLTCYTAFVKDTNLWLVAQLMRKGSSFHCLQTARRKSRQAHYSIKMEPHIMYILHETLLGLQYIHNNGQIHRDVKAGNILLDGNGDVRIADFGVSGWLVQGGSKATTFVGTPCWMAPEVMEQIHGYDTKADVWSLGITALELAKGYAPYAKYSPMKVLILTIQEDPPSLETYDLQDDDSIDGAEDTEEWSKSFQSMIQMCLQKNPAQRPTCQELLQSRHFSAFADETYRQAARDNIREEICYLVDDVGISEGEASEDSVPPLPGTVTVSFVSTSQHNRPAGTTWVFADGLQVPASSTIKSEKSDGDVFDELDEFERQTGGENYARGSSDTTRTTNLTAAAAAAAANTNTTAEVHDEPKKDDLEDFMDEFEKSTAGENFRAAP